VYPHHFTLSVRDPPATKLSSMSMLLDATGVMSDVVEL
jgi:hypothetical protein